MSKKKILIIIAAIIIIFVICLVILLNNKEDVTTQNKITNSQVSATAQNDIQIAGILINKSDITSTAKIYKYTSENVDIEVMAVKATDGSIRTALNTCQVCYDSGKGYYKQVGSYMVCQNCGNKFNLNQIEKVKGGCNPVPVLAEDKTETENTITISEEYLDSQKSYFEN